MAELRARHPAVRWLTPEKLHLTLVFLGPTDPASIDRLAAAVGSVAERHAAFEVSTGAAGGRINNWRGGVVWLRLTWGADSVTRLALELDGEIGSQTYAGQRQPRPHLTVARGATDDALGDLGAVAGDLRITWSVNRIVLFRSHTERSGSRYEELCAASLRAGVLTRQAGVPRLRDHNRIRGVDRDE